MDKIYILLLSGFALFAITAYNYLPPRAVAIQLACDMQSGICAHCPRTRISKGFNTYAYILHQQPFSVLVAEGIGLQKDICRNYLELVDSSLTLKMNQYLYQQEKSGQIRLERSSSLIFTQFFRVRSQDDFVMYSKGRSIQPQVYVEMGYNAANLLKYSRMLSWSCLLALVMAAVVRKLGWNIFVGGKEFPWLEITALSFSLLFADDQAYFRYFGVVQAMYLCVMRIRINETSKNETYHMLFFLTLCFLSSNFVILGQIYLSYLFLRQRKDYNTEKSAIVSLLLINLLLKICSFVFHFNYLTFLQILFTVIFFPIIFLILQSSSSRPK